MLAVPDVPATAAWYARVLGFEVLETQGAFWALLRNGGAELMLQNHPHWDGANLHGQLYFYTKDARALFDAVRAAEPAITVVWAPEQQDYGMVDFAVLDLNGIMLTFGHDPDA